MPVNTTPILLLILACLAAIPSRGSFPPIPLHLQKGEGRGPGDKSQPDQSLQSGEDFRRSNGNNVAEPQSRIDHGGVVIVSEELLILQPLEVTQAYCMETLVCPRENHDLQVVQNKQAEHQIENANPRRSARELKQTGEKPQRLVVKQHGDQDKSDRQAAS